MKTIYNVYVPMESQEQCDRMLQLCNYYQLPCWQNIIAFEYIPNSRNDFGCMFQLWYVGISKGEKQKVTEQEFIELLKNTKLC